MINWNKLTKEEALAEIKEKSKDHPVIIFKHSTRCPVSMMALNWFESSWKEAEMLKVEPYFLDLIANRGVSNMIAEVFNVRHESPQLLLIENGKCEYHKSHHAISYKELKQYLEKK